MSVDNSRLLQLQKQIEAAPPQALYGEIEKLQAASKKDKKNPYIAYAAGMMLCKLGDFESGAGLLKQSLKLAKANSIILGSLAFAHMTGLRDYISAMSYLEQRLELEPNHPETLLLIANCQFALGNPEEALESINEAEANSTDKLRIHGMRSNCYVRLKDYASARKEYEAIAKLEPTGIIAVGDMMAGLPDNTTEQLKDLQLQLSEAITKSPEKFRDDMHRCTTLSALGNIEEKLGNHKAAFDNFKQANEVQPLDQNASAIQETLEFETQKAVFTKTFFEENKYDGHQSKEQIFVLGMPLAGTSIIGGILTEHSKIVGCGELGFFNQQAHHIGITNSAENELENKIFNLKTNLLTAPKDGFVNIGKQYITQHRLDKLKGICKVDNMPLNFRALGLIALVFPNAKIIHSVRHPLDTCLSLYRTPLRGYNRTFANDLETLGQFYIQYAELMRHWREVLPLEIHDVRYEDIVGQPEAKAKEVISYMGLDWEDDCLDEAQLESIDRTSVNQWQSYEDQLKPLSDILSDEIKRYEAQN